MPSENGDAEGVRILVVDDEESITDLLATALRYERFVVEVAHSGRQALRTVAAFRPDLMVLDVMLPDWDGFDVAKRLAEQRARLVFSDLEMDDDLHQVRRAGRSIELTATEYNLLRFLLANAPRVLTKAQILDRVWNYDFGGDGNVVETYISYLRKKVDRDGPPLIHTVRGVGYCLRLPPD
jgi:two-component system OmpR family response regulator